MGHGWVAADVRGSVTKQFEFIAEVGYKPMVDLNLYADAWAHPAVSQYGADIAAQYKGNLEVFASGWVDSKERDSGADAGVRWRF